jgi:hypothetical protein
MNSMYRISLVTMERPLVIQNTAQYSNQAFVNSANVYNKMSDYDVAYTNYLTCLETHPKIPDQETEQIQRDPSLNYVYSNTSCVPPDSASLLQDIKTLQSNVMRMSSAGDISYNEIIKKHQEMVKLRNEMDFKLQQLYNVKNSVPIEMQMETDTTVYATIMWTILATSMVYLIFILDTA